MIDVYENDDYPSSAGSHKVGELNGINYNQLVEIMRAPPTITNPSGDGKVQVTWILEFGMDDPEVFTIYDWKTFSEYETKNTLTKWSIGGTNSGRVEEMKSYIYKKLSEVDYVF
tara:strand:+ start:266 stop:607 length:342 start_codon:yes stop_codon:yes gene_type:complete